MCSCWCVFIYCCCCSVAKSWPTLWPHGLQHARLLCPLSHWCYLTISFSATLFSFGLQSFPASGSFPMSRLSTSGGQNIGTSASVLPIKVHGWFPLGLTSMISLLSKGLSRVFYSTTIWNIISLVLSLLYGLTLASKYVYMCTCMILLLLHPTVSL